MGSAKLFNILTHCLFKVIKLSVVQQEDGNMNKPQNGILKLIGLNVILIGMMIYIYPQFAESEMFTDGAVTMLYGIGIILVAISIVLILSKIYITKQLSR